MLEVQNLTKYFSQKLAVDNISFTVRTGEVLGLLGPNGAGKSTTIRMITGFYRPSAGTVVIGGHDIQTAAIAARRKIGYSPESAPTYKEMTVRGFLDFIAQTRGFGGREKQRRIDRVIERCFLSEVRHQTIDTLSKGYNQRVCFAQCLLHDPEYLVMDEPTDGLDPNQKHEVRAMIREMSTDKTIVLSTHNLEEVDALCHRVIIIGKGKLLAQGTPASLKSKSRVHGTVRFTLNGVDQAAALKQTQALPSVKSAEVICRSQDHISIRAFPRASAAPLVQDIVRYFQNSGHPVASFFVEEGRLDEVFRSITLADNR